MAILDAPTSTIPKSLEPLAAISAKRPSRHNGVEVDPKRLLGAFYTPDNLAGILVRWALMGNEGAILDPSFGGCAFLTAAVRELARKGVKEPGRQVFGVDVDRDCIEHVRRNVRLVEKNCLVQDFFDLTPEHMPGTPFKAIVGNPPFVRHHWLKSHKRDAARFAIAKAGVDLPATASTWAYFLVHALAFLEEGGRVAMLVPEAILQADYAAPIRDALAERFSRVLLVHIRDRLFERTDEPVVVVAAEGYGKRGKITIEAIKQADDLGGVLRAAPPTRRRATRITVANGRTVSSDTIEILEELAKHKAVRQLSEIATVRIGFVTGANGHFIRGTKELEHLGIPTNVRVPVLARTKWLSGLDFTEDDHRELVAAGRRAFLIRPTPRSEEHAGVRAWIEEGEAAGVQDRFKCARRAQWFRVELPKIPDVFATCTRLGSPLLVINSGRFRCSNALHAVYWLPKSEIAPESVVIGFLTSVVSVWAELHGRRYGGGVLKLEPGKLVGAPVPIVKTTSGLFAALSRLMRAGREDEARRLADRVVLGEAMGLQERDLRELQRARNDLASQRIPTGRMGRRA